MNFPHVPVEYRGYTTAAWLVCGLLTLRHALRNPQIKAEPTLGWGIASVGLVIAFPNYWVCMGIQRAIIWAWKKRS